MTPDLNPLDQWLSDATRGLSAESAARVREEIQQHYDSACEAGGDAIAGLGDARAANRAYRKVLLTKRDVWMARELAHSKRTSIWNLLYDSFTRGGAVWMLSGRHDGSGWPITISVLCTTPLAWFFPLTSLERSRVYICLGGIRLILGVAAAWWFAGWMSALVLGAALFLRDYSTIYKRVPMFRKLAAGQTYSLPPRNPS